MIGVLFATDMEAAPFLERDPADTVVTKVSGMGMEAARQAAEALIREHGCTTIVNAGVCGALNNRLERGAVYRVSMVSTEHLKTAVKVGVGFGLKRLVTVEEPVFDAGRRRELSRYGELVDMEGYAVARVCEELNVPCILIKGVTDFGDGRGKEDIRQHIDPVSRTVAEAVSGVIEAAASGEEAGGPERETAPSMLRRLHSFTRLEHTVFSLPLLFAGAWLGAGGRCPPLSTLLLIALVGLGARTFGMAVNRILDRRIDAANPRTKDRELPAGRLSLLQACVVAGAGVAVYFAGCALLGSTVLRLSLIPLIPLSLYSLLKRFTPLCHYGIGVCLAAAPLGAYVAVTDRLDFTPGVVLLALFTFCWISGFDIIYALMDAEFDRDHGVRSLPASLGPAGAQLVAALTHLAAFAALVMLWMSIGSLLSFAALLVAAGAFGAAYLQMIPVHVRFFPISAVAGIAGALVVLLGGAG
jgi:4-hydroxybenzoate polyprenyltransferase